MSQNNRTEKIPCQFFVWPIYQYRNGVWYADGRSNGAGCKRTSLASKDKREAIANLHQLDRVQAANLGLIPRSATGATDRRLSIEAGRKLFDKHRSRPRLVGGTKPSTQKRYRAILDKFVDFLQQKRIHEWGQVTERTLEEYAKYLTDKDYAYKTVYGELNTIKTVFRWLCTEKHIDREPLKVKLTKAECQRAYCYTSEEVAAMLELCSESDELDWLRSVITALACTGLRISELAALRWSDIRLDDGVLTVADESGFVGQKITRRSTKNSRSRRLPIQKELLSILQTLPRRDAHVFLGPRGGRLKPDTVRNILVREVIEPLSSRFPKVYPGERSFEDGRLHSFRHYFCSACANRGIAEWAVMEWLGHADSEMVRHYYHLSDDESRRKMNQLNLLGNDDGRTAIDDEQNS